MSGGSTAFLLAQIGAHAAERFAARVAELGLTPPQSGLLRVLAVRPGESQQRYAEQLGMPASRFVTLVDGLEQRGVVERRRSDADRRAYGLYLTTAGQELLAELGAAAQAHDRDLTAGLSAADRATLQRLLGAVADHQGLTPGVHPGYKHI